MSTPLSLDGRVRNRLLAALPPTEEEGLHPHLEPVTLGLKEMLYAPDTPIDYVYFPLDGVASLLSIDDNGGSIEIGTVGNEGFVGLPVFLGATTTPGQIGRAHV